MRDGKLLAMDIDFVIDGGAYCTLSPVVLVARHDPRGRSVLLSERPRSRPGRRDQRAAARRVPRVRRAAEHLRARDATWTASREAARLDPGRIPPAQLHPNGPDERRRARSCAIRSTWPRCSIARSRCRTITPSERGSRRQHRRADQAGNRLRDVHARRRLHRLGRGSPRLARGRRGDGRRAGARAGGEHRDRTGHEHDLLADRRRRARHRCGRVEVAQPDTAAVPNSGPTVASRTCMVVGKLVESAALGLKADAQRRRPASGRLLARTSSTPPAPHTSRSTGRCARRRSTSRREGVALGRRAVPGRRLRRRTRGRSTSPR